jgi:hypothetical protein
MALDKISAGMHCAGQTLVARPYSAEATTPLDAESGALALESSSE